MTRVARFYTVGLLGILVQLGALAIFTDGIQLNHWISTPLPVEIAVIHNFLWHERWTWRDRRTSVDRWSRFVRFNLTTGMLSILANVLVTGALVDLAGIPYLLANLLAIAAASVLTYLLADCYVFTLGRADSSSEPDSERSGAEYRVSCCPAPSTSGNSRTSR